METLAEVRAFIRDLDSQHCPIAKRQRELEAEKRERKAREAREQQQAANNSESWWLESRSDRPFMDDQRRIVLIRCVANSPSK